MEASKHRAIRPEGWPLGACWHGVVRPEAWPLGACWSGRNMKVVRHASPLMGLIGLLVLSGCGGGGSGGGAMQYAVGGIVTGLVPTLGTGSQLVLAVNGGDHVFLNANGAFHFS